MAIKIISKPDVHVTADELNRYRHDFDQENSMYCGPRRDFEEYVLGRKNVDSVRKRPENRVLATSPVNDQVHD